MEIGFYRGISVIEKLCLYESLSFFEEDLVYTEIIYKRISL